MAKIRPRVPIGLPIAVGILLIMGAVAGPIIRATVSEQQLARNVLLSAIPFVLIFAAIVLTFITLVTLVASVLNHNIPTRVYRPIELIIIAGIIVGVVGMFQPWLFIGFRSGFLLLLVSTLAFILWSHIIPQGAYVDHTEVGSVSISEFEKHESGG